MQFVILLILLCCILGVLTRIAGSQQQKANAKVKRDIANLKANPAPPEAFDDDANRRKCPECAEMIKKEAKTCRFCGASVTPEVVEDQPATSGSTKNITGKSKELPPSDEDGNVVTGLNRPLELTLVGDPPPPKCTLDLQYIHIKGGVTQFCGELDGEPDSSVAITEIAVVHDKIKGKNYERPDYFVSAMRALAGV